MKKEVSFWFRPKLYLSCLFVTVGLFVVFAIIANLFSSWLDFDTPALIVAIIMVALLIASQVFALFVQYHIWKKIIERFKKHPDLEPRINSAGKAVGFQFIPFYNLYWIFPAYHGMATDINRIASKEKLNIRLSEGLGLVIPIFTLIGLIPYVGTFLSVPAAFILLPIYLTKAFNRVEAWK